MHYVTSFEVILQVFHSDNNTIIRPQYARLTINDNKMTTLTKFVYTWVSHTECHLHTQTPTFVARC